MCLRSRFLKAMYRTVLGNDKNYCFVTLYYAAVYFVTFFFFIDNVYDSLNNKYCLSMFDAYCAIFYFDMVILHHGRISNIQHWLLESGMSSNQFSAVRCFFTVRSHS